MKLLKAPVAPTKDTVYVASFTFTMPELVKFPVKVSVDAAVEPVRFNAAPLLTVVVPVMVRFLDPVSNVPLAPWPTAKLPATVKLLVAILTLAPLAIVKLFIVWLALMVFDAPDIVTVLPVLVHAPVTTTLPEALIADVPDAVNVPAVCEKSLVLSVPANVWVPSVWL